jgi:nucleotide-binding universal stress UspA family protein
VDRVSVQGNAAREILNHAKSHAVDLIVMGKRGYSPVRRLILGSTAMEVLHEAQCHIWMRHTDEAPKARRRGELRHILCSIDLSDGMLPLLQITRDFAAGFDATVHLIHCLTGDKQDLVEEEMARGEIDQIQERAGTEFPVLIREGKAAAAVANAALEYESDLVIVGRGKAQQALGTLRTHVPELIHEAPCAVLSLES